MNDAERFDRMLARAHDKWPEAAVAEARLFFTQLDPRAGRGLASKRTDQVGELDGAPARLRYLVNHVRLARDREALFTKVRSGGGTDHDVTRLDTLTRMLEPVRELGVAANGRAVPVELNRQFLSLRTDGEGRAVEVFGDLDTARNVAILVPGMGNSLETLPGQAARARAIRTEAGPGTAVVAWMGYDFPNGVVEAADKQPAYAAVPALRRFTAGLGTEIRPDARTTLIGHSYGSTVVGQALLNGVRYDNVIFTGSPGIDHDIRSAADLGSPGTRFFAARSPGDIVAYTQWHGPDPAGFADVMRLRTAGGVPVDWHNNYYRPRSESLRNVGRVVRGDYAAVTTTDTTSVQETRLLPGVSWAAAIHAAAVPVSAAYNAVHGGHRPPRIVVPSSRRPEGQSR